MIFNSSVFFILFLAGTVFDFALNQFSFTEKSTESKFQSG